MIARLAGRRRTTRVVGSLAMAVGLGSCASLARAPVAAPAMPTDFATMTVAARWSVGSRDAFEHMRSAFPDGGQMFGHALVAPTGEKPRRIVERDYDGEQGQLATAMRSLRYRTQYVAYLDAEDATHVERLDAASWKPEWSRLEYASTPCRIGAVWFRREVGGRCNLWERKRKALCERPLAVKQRPDAPTAIAPYLRPSPRKPHEAITVLRADHPALGVLQPIRRAVAYRHTVELRIGDEPAYELTLDQRRVDDDRTVAYEAGLAIVGTVTEERVRKLLTMVAHIESRTELELTERRTIGADRHVPACR